MKNIKTTVALSLLAVLAVLAPKAVRADLIWYEGFNYPNGSVVTNSVIGPSTNSLWWRESGSANPMDLVVNNHQLQVFATSGNVSSRQDDCDRLFSLTNNSVYTNTPQLVYASFTVMCTNLPNGPGSYFASFYSGPIYIWTSTGYVTNNSSPGFTNFTGLGYSGRIQAFTNGSVLPNTWRLGVTGNTLATNAANGGYPVDLALNTPYQVVAELDPVTLQAASVWVNPLDITQSGNAATETHYTSSDSLGFATTTQVNSFAFRQASSFNACFTVSNLAVATTFAEAATNVWNTNAVPPVIVYQPVNIHNFPGSSFILSVVANGQGLANLNYQWQENGNNISNPNGNSNILPFTSVPSSSGTNSYDVVVTTPYGLSATSAVVTVAIDTTPQPPIFVSQPASQSLYAGQNALFTAVVASPGNVSFTWYSNNVVVTAGVTSSSYSSTIEIDNITSANAATYKVAVTNDVFATGVVSTNASLSVKVPAAVSIAYLHSLVSPSTYQPTNVPPSIAYKATGVVTTYTNLTTGITSSYYLQDGTGGINIFVTGDSTFRPQLGDVVTFVGVLSSFTSGIELYADVTVGTAFPYTSYSILSNNIAGLPTPRLIPYNFITNIPYANTNLGGSLVQIKDVYFGARAGSALSTTANDTVVVTNSAGQTFQLFFPDLDLDVAGKTLPSYAYTVSGVLYSQNSVVTNEIVVTQFASLATNLAPIPITVTNAGQNLTLTWASAAFNLQHATNVAGPYTNLPNTSPYTVGMTNPAGFYRLKF